MLFKANGDEEKALKALQSAVEMDKGWASSEIKFMSLYSLSHHFNSNYQFDGCEKYAKQALAGDTGQKSLDSLAYFQLGLCLYHQNKLREAYLSFKEAFELNPYHLWAGLYYGEVLYQYDPAQKNKVIEIFDLVVESSEGKINELNEVIRFWQAAGDQDMALYYCDLSQRYGLSMDEMDNCD